MDRRVRRSARRRGDHAGGADKTIPGEAHTVTATVEAIEKATRAVTVKKPDGTYDVLYVPESIKRFDTLKVGDKVNARYYENVVLQVKPAGEKDVDRSSSALTRSPDSPAGTAAHQRTITATITAIDMQRPVDLVRRAERLEVLVARRGQGRSWRW